MCSSDTKMGAIDVRSAFGPIRIELFDGRLRREAIGFGTLCTAVPAGLYTLQYGVGADMHDEIVRVLPGSTLSRRVSFAFSCAAPITVSSTTQKFHEAAAEHISVNLRGQHGSGGGIMVFVRNIDKDGRSPPPIEQLSLLSQNMQPLAAFSSAAERRDDEGWVCFSGHVDPGGYLLRWRARSGGEQCIDQSLWVSKGWLTIVFIGYSAASNQLERQRTSIHMVRLNAGFQPGPDRAALCSRDAPERILNGACVNQALELALCGLRTGRQAVPDTLPDMLEIAGFENPMLGIVGAHAMLQRTARDWETFTAVIAALRRLIPDHPDVDALDLCGSLLREQTQRDCAEKVNWAPMMSLGYSGLIKAEWRAGGGLIAADSLAERAAAMMLPELPWSCWLSLQPSRRRSAEKLDLPSLVACLGSDRALHPSFWQVIDRLATAKVSMSDVMGAPGDCHEIALRRVARHIGSLLEFGELGSAAAISIADFQDLSLPVASVTKAIATLQALVNGAERDQAEYFANATPPAGVADGAVIPYSQARFGSALELAAIATTNANNESMELQRTAWLKRAQDEFVRAGMALRLVQSAGPAVPGSYPPVPKSQVQQMWRRLSDWGAKRVDLAATTSFFGSLEQAVDFVLAEPITRLPGWTAKETLLVPATRLRQIIDPHSSEVSKALAHTFAQRFASASEPQVFARLAAMVALVDAEDAVDALFGAFMSQIANKGLDADARELACSALAYFARPGTTHLWQTAAAYAAALLNNADTSPADIQLLAPSALGARLVNGSAVLHRYAESIYADRQTTAAADLHGEYQALRNLALSLHARRFIPLVHAWQSLLKHDYGVAFISALTDPQHGLVDLSDADEIADFKLHFGLSDSSRHDPTAADPVRLPTKLNSEAGQVLDRIVRARSRALSPQRQVAQSQASSDGSENWSRRESFTSRLRDLRTQH